MPASSVTIYFPNYTSVLFITCVLDYLSILLLGKVSLEKKLVLVQLCHVFLFLISYIVMGAVFHVIYHSLFIIHLPQLCIEKNTMIIYLGGNCKISSLTAMCAYH
jgi:hypothetical protein